MKSTLRENYKILLFLSVILIAMAGLTLKIIFDKHTFVNESTREVFSDKEDDSTYYTDLAGNKVSLEQYLGRIMVVNSWASWSPFSVTELTSLQKLAEKYNTNEVVFLAINRKESKDQAQRFVNTLPELTSIEVVIDVDDHFYTSVGGYAMPETIIYDKTGNIIEHIHGTFKEEIVGGRIDELLNN